jgi:rubrerythrin
MVKREIKILVEDVITNENRHLRTFWKAIIHRFLLSPFQYENFEFDSSVFIESVI